MEKDTAFEKDAALANGSAMSRGKGSVKPDWKKIPISKKAYKDFTERITCVLEAVTQSQALVNEALEMFERYLRNEEIDIMGADPSVQIAFLMIRSDIAKAINRSYHARLRASARKLRKLVADYPLHRESTSTTEPAQSQPQEVISEPAVQETSAENPPHINENSENEVTENKAIEKEHPVRSQQAPAAPGIKTRPQPYINPFNQPAAPMNRSERRHHERELLRMQKHQRQK